VDDDTFLAHFEACTLPFEQWTHRAHVKVAWLYLRAYPLEDAIDRIRAGIKAYNNANDVPDGPGMGYNETVTHAFMHIVHATMQAYGELFPVKTADEFCIAHPHLLHRSLIRIFYSPDGRRDFAAEKTRFVEPDMCDLPRFRPRGTAR
jgi:hypothetical protein